ncbi:hypothetical protein QEH52_03675 [Coraliomargarita sp. SDUM461003]|uniref:Lipoprotein SmpA/OmlA domain-containing protein n=1 Tax=Thalassobacterium maritimum TaxID=3041265 RepID=A0ABU1AR15_9BACT|nr:hypothetical protein [Coraliomargarita sp. SDUM461003]MDQ8206593.1 hypothetical protein [Coraliomargarita sp. SDUM461003]
MKKYTSYCSLSVLVCSSIFFLSTALQAQDVSRDEFNALAQRVQKLEASLRVVKNTQVESLAAEVVASMPMNQDDRDSLIENVVKTIQSKEEDVNYPWMNAEKWGGLTKGMSPEAVVAVLGIPTLDEPSMHKRVDVVYTYKGRRVATGEKVEGVVRFYKSKLIEVEIPNL